MPRLTGWQNGKSSVVTFEGTPCLGKLLASQGFGVQQPCGGRGVCRKCAVKASGALSPMTEAEEKAGVRLACQIICLGDCEVILPDTAADVKIETDGAAVGRALNHQAMAGEYGAAVDIGTTTVALKLFDLRTGQCLSKQAAVNPQTQTAADVIGRIGAALDGMAAQLRETIQRCIRELLSFGCEEAGVQREQVASMVLTGNTTMLYLLTERNPEPLSHAPFEADTLFGCTCDLLGRSAYLPPCMDAFVGADITCAVMASGMCAEPETALLMDVGTNGEVALWHEGVLYVTSTAAGPAFEGAGIACGCGSVTGAIDKVWREKDSIAVHTIGDQPATGICGSGLIDAVAVLLELGLIDETGAMDEEQISLSGSVYLSAKDVRSVQLAKGAIAAGVETMLRTVGVTAAAVSRLFIAGGFGSHIDVHSAAAIGLIPEALSQRIKVLGNASLTGAEMLLLDTTLAQEAQQVAAMAKPVLLGGNPLFSDLYMEHMMFE